MSKNNKKAHNLANLIPLGQKPKPRNVISLPPAAKRVKLEDFNPSTFISTIEQSVKHDNGSSETLLINYLNSIKSTLIISSKNGKILPSQCLALFSVCKKFPSLFTKTTVLDCVCGILNYNGKETANINSVGSSFKTQSAPTHNNFTSAKLKQLHIALCSVLLMSFKDTVKWPINLLKSYLDDSFTDRVWVDLPECNLLVKNIETAFPPTGIDIKTFFPLSAMSEQLVEIHTEMAVGDSSDSPEGNIVEMLNKILSALTTEEIVKQRFEHNKLSVESMISGYIKENAERKYIPESQLKNIMRTFCSLSGLPEMRGAVVTKLDNWLLSKLQNVTLNMLTIMANSCNQNISQNPHDITFCVYLMLRFKYKTSKPPIQIALLDCLKRISEMHPNNLRNMLHIYVNNELYGTPTVTAGTTISIVNNPTNSSNAHTMVNKAISVTFPAIYFRFPAESIKILGDLLHEQMCIHFADIKPIKILIRDLCRWIKLAHSNAGGVYSSFTTPGVPLADSLELLELTQSLLVDRSNSESLVSRMGNPLFKQTYVDNMISVLCELQMLSITRPSVKETFKDKSDSEKKDLDSLKHHYATLRQIRYLTCKWLKSIFRLVESQISAERMTYCIKQIMFLNVVRTQDQNYIVEDSYAINEVWNTEPDKATLIKGLTEIPLSDKLIQTMISLGFEKHLCYRPSEIVEMLSELIIRASACASADIMAMNVTKGETVINNMFACCSYDLGLEEADDPRSQIVKTFAFKSSFWKVCQALVIMACHCTESCGSYLWANYPTIKNLMKIVITNDFENSTIDEEFLANEKLYAENEMTKIIELESSLIEDGNDISFIDTNNSKLKNILMINSPQGPARQPPQDVIQSLKSINSTMKIGDRLSQCRNPDFLLEIVKGQDQSKVENRKWIIDLVKKTSEPNLECLPLLCLTEFIYHDLYDGKLSSLSSSTSSTVSDTFRTLVHQIRQTLQNSVKSDNLDTSLRIVGAFSNSFFNRLSDALSSTRNIARECLFILLQPVGSSISNMNDNSQFLDTLKSLINVKLFQEKTIISTIVESLQDTLKFETDIDILCCYIELFASMSSSTANNQWLLGLVDTLAILILNRPVVTEKLLSRDHDIQKNKRTATLVSDMLSQIFLAYFTYINQAEELALDNRNDIVMVAWKEKRFPIAMKIIQSQLSFLCWPIVKSQSCKKLAEIWFIKTGKSYELPQFTSVTPSCTLSNDTIIPQWLVNSSVTSGSITSLTSILGYHLKENRKICHSITPALLFMPIDFISSYLKFMNSVVKEEKTLLESWIVEIPNKSSVLSTIEKLFSKVKRLPPVFIDCLKGHLSSCPVVQKINLEPNIIVKPLIEQKKKNKENVDNNEMEVENDVTQVWSSLIQSYKSEHGKGLSIESITKATNLLLSANDNNNSDNKIRGIIENLIKLLKDSKTHSETLRVLNKSDFKLLPLLKLTFRCVDQDSFDFCMESFEYLFNSYPHIEKLSVWKMAYNLCLIQQAGTSQQKVDEEEHDNGHHNNHTYSTMVKSLVIDIMHGAEHNGNNNDNNEFGKNDSRKVFRQGSKIDQLTILGLGNSSNLGDDSHDTIHKLLFSSHSLYQYSAYFMSDLLHQSNIESLRNILHSLLQKKALSNLNASRALDFIDASINHPKLQFPCLLTVSKRHLWPQQNVPFEISEQELINLIGLVVNETDHLVQHNGLNSKHVNDVLSKRCQLIEISSSHPNMIQKRSTIINQYLDSKSRNPTIEKLTFAIYCRIPSLISSAAREGGLPVDSVDCFGTSVLHIIGKRVLAGLVSSRADVQDCAVQSCKALVQRHPKLSVQLLPYISAIGDGALDNMECWSVFKKKRGNLLYSTLLDLLSMMVPFCLTSVTNVRADVDKTLGNFLRLLIRYRDQPTVFSLFVTKLVDFIEKLITFEGNVKHSFVVDNFLEITALSKIYPQFKNLVGYDTDMQKPSNTNRERNNNTAILQASTPLNSDVTSKSLLDCLDNFRTEMTKSQSGNGLSNIFKLLITADTSITNICLDDLRSCLCSPMNDVRQAAKQFIGHYLNYYPEQARRFVSNCLTPNIMKSTHYWSRPFANIALSTLRQTVLLAPDCAPSCLSNYGRLFISGHNGRGNYKESISLLEDILDNISLESSMDCNVQSASVPVIVVKDVVGQKRQFPSSDHDSHNKAKKMRFK